MTNGLFGGCFGHFNMYHHLKSFDKIVTWNNFTIDWSCMYLDVRKSVHHHNGVNIVLFNQTPEVRLCRRQWHLCNDVIILSPEALLNIRKNTVNSAYKELIGTQKICSLSPEFFINVHWTCSLLKIWVWKSVSSNRMFLISGFIKSGFIISGFIISGLYCIAMILFHSRIREINHVDLCSPAHAFVSHMSYWQYIFNQITLLKQMSSLFYWFVN